MLTYPSLEEVERLQYLNALGITSWLPTMPLVASQTNTVLWQQENRSSLDSEEPETTEMVSTPSVLSAVAKKPVALPLSVSTAPAAKVPAKALQNFDLSQEPVLIAGQIKAVAVAGALHPLSSLPKTMDY